MNKLINKKNIIFISIVILSIIILGVNLLSTKNIYEVEVDGHNGPIKVEVKIFEGVIEGINVIEHNETLEVVESTLDLIPKSIITKQSGNIDLITGATITGQAIIDAVSQCAKKAGLDLFSIKANDNNDIDYNQKEYIDVDVVVIGAGGAGLSAAVSASQQGASVLVIEKMTEIGGNTVRSIGMYNAVNPKLQKPLGINDSEDIFFKETFLGGKELADPKLVEILTSQAYDGMLWLEDLGVKFDTQVDSCLGGEYARGYYTMSHNGSDYIKGLNKYCTSNDVNILLETKGTSLIVEDNKITGIIAKQHNKEIIITANKGVIIATGGFGYNIEKRMEFDSSLTVDMLCSNAPGTTGDGIEMAKDVGANLINMQYIETYPLGDAYDGGLRNNIPDSINNGILINSDGKRFIAEDANRDNLSESILAQNEGFAYSVVDSDYLIDEKDIAYLEGLVSTGVVTKTFNVQELASKLMVNQNILEDEINKYNKFVDNQMDNDFNRKNLNNRIDEPPYYFAKKKPTIHYTLGGIQINENTSVINTQGNVIENLFAAGEVTGGIHGANRLGGNSLPDIIVFGRIAGYNAAMN